MTDRELAHLFLGVALVWMASLSLPMTTLSVSGSGARFLPRFAILQGLAARKISAGFRRGEFAELGSARLGPKFPAFATGAASAPVGNPSFASDQPGDLRSCGEASSTRARIIIQKMATPATMQGRRRPGMPPMGHSLEALIFRFELFFAFRLVFVGFAVIIPL
jgi:hypothetical protein